MRLKKYKEAELKLNENNNIPNGAYGYYLLGLINEKRSINQDTKEFYLKALELNPNLWIAYEKLCKMGEHIKSR